MRDLANLPIESPMTFRFLGGYLRIGMPLASWGKFGRCEVRYADMHVRFFAAGPFFAWVRFRKAGAAL